MREAWRQARPGDSHHLEIDAPIGSRLPYGWEAARASLGAGAVLGGASVEAVGSGLSVSAIGTDAEDAWCFVEVTTSGLFTFVITGTQAGQPVTNKRVLKIHATPVVP